MGLLRSLCRPRHYLTHRGTRKFVKKVDSRTLARPWQSCLRVRVEFRSIREEHGQSPWLNFATTPLWLRRGLFDPSMSTSFFGGVKVSFVFFFFLSSCCCCCCCCCWLCVVGNVQPVRRLRWTVRRLGFRVARIFCVSELRGAPSRARIACPIHPLAPHGPVDRCGYCTSQVQPYKQ